MRVYLDMVGCRLNQAEIEQYARQFYAAGYTLVARPEEADVAVINTCTVTTAADADSRQKVRQMARAGVQNVVVTGCWATLQPQEAAKLPNVSRIVPNADKDHLVADLLQLPLESFEPKSAARQPVPGARLRTRAFIKVQDGCNHHCAYCITTLARGAGRSCPVSAVLADIRACSSAKEVVLTGVHLGSWGQDLKPPMRLRQLIEAILRETDLPRLRLSSLEPWDLESEFFALWENPRLCRHLHLPLQSGSAATLRRMWRNLTPEAYAQKVETARTMIPGLAITTDVIVGFPGESDEEFAESQAFVRQMNFAGGHVFTYSPRPGTLAAQMPHQVPEPLRKERNAQMRLVFEVSSRQYQAGFLGYTLPVLWESATHRAQQSWEVKGLTDNYLRVSAIAQSCLWNQITPVRLTDLDHDGLRGVILDPTSEVNQTSLS